MRNEESKWRKKEKKLDGVPLAIGIATLLRQFHPSYLIKYIQYLGHFIKSTAQYVLTATAKQGMPIEVVNGIHMVDLFVKYADVPRTLVETFLPKTILDTILT